MRASRATAIQLSKTLALTEGRTKEQAPSIIYIVAADALSQRIVKIG